MKLEEVFKIYFDETRRVSRRETGIQFPIDLLNIICRLSTLYPEIFEEEFLKNLVADDWEIVE
jgi:hypothetical protein